MPKLLHVGTVIQATFAAPDGKGNAHHRTLTFRVADLSDAAWLAALEEIRGQRRDAETALPLPIRE